MAGKRRERKDRTSLIISVVLHLLLIAGVVYWAHKTGKLQEWTSKILEVVRSEKKEKREETKPVQQQRRPPPSQRDLPKINEGTRAPVDSGTRRAVAADAPEAVGETFFQDTRAQGQGPSTGGAGPAQQKPKEQAIVVVSRPPPPSRPALQAAARPSTVKQLLVERSKAAAATEAVGSEQISKSAASDAGAVVNRVAGASIVEGKFAVIRGLSDRYVGTTLNGAEIPSADPYRRSASLDLFPAQVIDRVVVGKTFTPDQQAAYTGGGINIMTRSFPERPFANFSLGGSYNTQANLQDEYLTYDGGGTDWLGMDDGTRALPSELATPNSAIPSPPFSTGRFPPTSAAYQQRVTDAETLNRLTKAMGPTQLGPETTESPLNSSFSVAAGDTTLLQGRPLGVFSSLNYKRDFNYYSDGVQRRESSGTEQSYFDEARSSTVVNWSGMVNMAYQPWLDHELGFNFLFNQASDDQTRFQTGYRLDATPEFPISRTRLYWVERSLSSMQFKGAHGFPSVGGVKLDWLAAFSSTSQDEPDARFFNWIYTGQEYSFSDPRVGSPTDPTRYYRELDEDNRNLKLDLAIPFRHSDAREGELKLGLFSNAAEREYVEKEVYYKGNPATFNGDPNTVLTQDLLGYTAVTNANNRIDWTWTRYLNARDGSYDASSTFQAAYGMLDTEIVPHLRFIGGVRYETTEIKVDSQSDLSGVGSTDIDEPRLLPALSLVYALRTNMNLRLAFSQTIARPSFRELAKTRSYDPVLDEILEGNPNLEVTDADNFDLRWEWFPRPGEVFSLSLFYKDLLKPVERSISLDQEFVTFINREDATVWGVELEARKALDFLSYHLRPFSLGFNFSYIQSETSLYDSELFNKRAFVDPDYPSTRALYDQSPYIMNVDLNYDLPATGTSASLLLNLAAPRIAISTLTSEDVYEHPATALDFVFSQKITRHASIKFTARNLLDPVYKRTYGDSPSDPLYSSFHRGRTFGLSFAYDF